MVQVVTGSVTSVVFYISRTLSSCALACLCCPHYTSTWHSDTLAQYHTFTKESEREVSALAAFESKSPSHYCNWDAPACSADSRTLWCCLLWFQLFFSCRNVLTFFSTFSVVANEALWSTALESQTVWGGVKAEYLWMAFNSRGGMNCWIFLALFSVPPHVSVSRPPHCVSAWHPIVCYTEPSCENQQMGNFVCVAGVGVCVWKQVGERELRSRE